MLQLANDIKKGDKTLTFQSLLAVDTTSKITIEDLDSTGAWVKNEAELAITAYDSSTNKVTVAAVTLDHATASTRVTVTKLPDAATSAAKTLNVYSTSVGQWGNKILLRAVPTSQAKTPIADVIGDAATSTQYQLKSKNGFYAGAIVVFDNGTTKQYRQILSLQNDVAKLSSHLVGDAAVKDTTSYPTKTLATCEFNLEVYALEDMNKQGQTVQVENLKETFSNLSINPNTDNYFEKIINNRSKYIQLTLPTTPSDLKTAASQVTNPFMMPENNTLKDGNWWFSLTGGSDGTVGQITSGDFQGTDNGPGKRTGLQAFQEVDDVSIMAIPGVTSPDVQAKLTAHCDLYRDRFAVLDVPSNYQQISDVQKHRNLFDTSYAALYHPWLKVYDPVDKQQIFVPPSGSIMGIYARTDNDKGVFKAPANETVQNTTDLMYLINKGDQDMLNPIGVNCIRAFTGRGIRVWGARTCSSDPLWKYINVRRLFIFLEKSIETGTQWVVFEPNNEKLWDRVRQTIAQFLTTQWKSGALMGKTPEEAFFVKCDRTTMTQDDIDNGRLIVMIGVAPTKPAEFVIFKIAQWQGGSAATE